MNKLLHKAKKMFLRLLKKTTSLAKKGAKAVVAFLKRRGSQVLKKGSKLLKKTLKALFKAVKDQLKKLFKANKSKSSKKRSPRR